MRKKLTSRLSRYWKMEAGNVLLLPFCAWFVVSTIGDGMSLWLGVAMLGCSGLLVIGAGAWRLELAQLQAEQALAEKLLRWLGPSRPLGIAFAVIGAIGGVMEWLGDGGFTPSAIAALVFGTLAVLEYVNYFVVQLQHFDHAPDFRRLISGKGFRKPHLARVVADWARVRSKPGVR